MFDLEPAIADWRQKMLAAGIETPAPLEELELHLRDEIERQLRAGLAAPQAFALAVQRIGEAYALKAEFQKIGPAGSLPNRLYDAVLAAFALLTTFTTTATIFWQWPMQIDLPSGGFFTALLRGLAARVGQMDRSPSAVMPWLIALNLIYIAAMVATLFARRYRPKYARLLTQLLSWALLPALPLGTLLGLYGMWCGEYVEVKPADTADSTWSRHLFTFTRTSPANQNLILKLGDTLFRIICGMIVGLIGCWMWLHAALQYASTDYSLIYLGGAFSFDRLIIGPTASLALGNLSLLLGVWMFWCALQIVFGPRPQPKLAS
jgi:hypothetical protein